MTLHLYYHPLASYCWKTLIALYESGMPFEPRIHRSRPTEIRAGIRAS